MVLMIDANVILDVLLNRDGFAADSAMVWKLCETRLAHGYISTLTFANIVYVMRKELTPTQVEEVYSKLRLIFDYASLDQSVIERAAAMRWEDYEDALQCAGAQKVGADYNITRNVRDFIGSSIPAITPRELLDIMR